WNASSPRDVNRRALQHGDRLQALPRTRPVTGYSDASTCSRYSLKAFQRSQAAKTTGIVYFAACAAFSVRIPWLTVAESVDCFATARANPRFALRELIRCASLDE